MLRLSCIAERRLNWSIDRLFYIDKGNKKAAQRPLSEFWCRRRDLNPHTRYGHKHLKLACLPFHHSDELLPKSNDD